MSTAEKQPQFNPVPLAIVGMGCLFPKADSTEAFWANIKGGVDAVTDIPASHWQPDEHYNSDPSAPDMTYAKRGAFIEPVDFNPLEFGITPNNIEATDTTQLLGMWVAQQALRNAGYATGKDSADGRPFNRDRTSVILGVTGALELVIPLGARLGHPIWRKALQDAGVAKPIADDVVQRISDSYVPWQENSFPGLLGNVAAGRIANRFDTGGTNCVVDAACASSLGAIHMAAMELYAGRAEMAITGGIDTFNDIFMYMCFSKTPALSPTGNSRPFSAGGDGTILGEGLGVLVLKRLADAQRDGDHIHAVIRSIGSSSDGKGNAVYAPSSDGQVRCLLAAYREAGVTPRTIELVEAHGTGTKVGDAVEAKALAEVYRTDKGEGTWCALGSVKSMIGHTKAAAGVAGLIKAALALDHKVLPPTIKVDRPLDAIEPGKAPVYVNTEKRPWLPRAEHPRRAGVSAFGFGGSNFHCVLEEAHSKKTAIDWDDNVLLFPFCADSIETLNKTLASFAADLPWNKLRSEAASLCSTFRPDATCRLVIVAQKNQADIAKQIHSAQRMLQQHPDRQTWNTPDGVYFGAGDPHKLGKLGVLFPGQGSQYVGMLRDLACQFPQMLDALAEADVAFEKMEHGQRLSDHVYPIPVFTDQARTANEHALNDTRVAQPALGAVSIGAWRVLEHFGIWADAAAGHSFGELVALCAAGRIDSANLHELARMRGEAMANAAAGAAADCGAMLAVSAPVADIQYLIEAEHLKLVIANKNSPNQVVLSGATSQIELAAAVLESRGIRNRRLTVSAAFHSPLVANAQKPFAKALKKVTISQGQIPVFANTTADVYPDEPRQAAELLAAQLAQPVEFINEIEKMYAFGVRTFLEVGPGGKLSGLVRAILHDREHEVVALDPSSGKRSGIFDLASTLGQLAALGHHVELTQWDATFAQRAQQPESKKPAMTIRLSGANYVKPRTNTQPRPKIVVEPKSAVVKSVPQPEHKGSIRLNQPPEKPVTHTPSALPAAAVPSSNMTQALQATQQSILALQQMQQQTAQLHQQYLQGQEQAQRTLHQLVEQQMRLLGNACGVAMPTTTPVMVPVQNTPQFADRSTTGLAASRTSPMVEPTKITTQAPAANISPKPPTVVPSDNRAQKVLLEVVADKTGYPVEMLELDMSLDTDLGIDSIKRVEILSALQTALPEAPVVKPEDLGRLQTLRQIVAFIDVGSATSAPAVSPTPAHTTNGNEKRGASPAANESQTVLLEVVADKTGYPVEMLELDMSLDTDLGIDSIKRVEILSALQTRLPEAPVVKPEDLGRLQTLRQIVIFLQNGTANVATKPAQEPAIEILKAKPAPVIVHAPKNGCPTIEDALDRRVLTVVPLNGQPARSALQLHKDAQIWVTDDGKGLAQKICQTLQSRHIAAKVVTPDAVPGSAPLAGLLILAPASPPKNFIQNTFKLIQRVGPLLRQTGLKSGAFLASASLLDGSFALNGHAPHSPITGGLAGLVKTASHEWPEVSCKSLDLSDDAHDLNQLAQSIVDELLLKGPLEVGISKSGRVETRLVSKALNGEVGKSSLTARDVVVVTGGARGVTAAVSLALAKEYRCKLLLLGRSTAPTPEPQWLSALTDEGQIKKALAAHITGPVTPRALEEQYRRAMANREVLATLQQIEASGAHAIYRSLDVRDANAVAAAINEARSTLGPIAGIIHGAGVLQDRLIEDKTPAQFDEVFSTKVDGFVALLQAVQNDDLKVIVAFSSSTGRFGRKGQVAYAAANEVLNKLAQQQAHQRTDCRVLSINWGPWEGGMVTPQLRKIFENEGVGLIPLQAGADYLVREMSTPAGGPVEIVIHGPEPKPLFSTHAEPAVIAKPDVSLNVAFARELDVESCPFLNSHVIKGKAVLPTAIIVEWLAHGAMHENPGLLFHGFDDLRIFKGVILDPEESVSIQVLAGPAVLSDGMELVPVELRSGNVLHARARIVLATELQAAQSSAAPSAAQPYSGEIYADGRLFHGPDLQGIESVEGWSKQGIIGNAAAAPAPSEWMQQPLRSGWLADPLALDASFQLMILWCFEAHGVGSLPTRAASYRQFARAFPQDGTRVSIRVIHATEHSAQAAIEFTDHAGTLVARMDGYECVMDATLNDSFTDNQLAQQVQP